MPVLRKRAPPPAHAFDEEQQAFLDAPTGVHLCLKAGAGAGKTAVLVERIKRLRQLGADVLVFSHANKTVDELKDRLDRAAVEGVTVLTMHKYCISRLLLAHLKRPESLDATIEELAELLEQGTLSVFEDYVVVDEAQDLSTDQMRIVRAIHAQDRARLILVGDLEQSIYGFQGSSPKHLRGYELYLKEEQRFQMRTNYRSSNSLIVEAANAIASNDIAAGRAVQMLPSSASQPQGLLTIIGYDSRGNMERLGEELEARVRYLWSQARGENILVLSHDNVRAERAHCFMLKRGIASILFSSKRSGEYLRFTKKYKRSDVLQFLTIHGIKGGQCSHVILITGEDRGDGKELDEDPEDPESSESRRLLYVAVTRAVKSFTVLYDRGQKAAQPCRWLSNAWGFFETIDAEKYQSSKDRRPWSSSPFIRVTDLVTKNGSLGLGSSFRSLTENAADLNPQLFFSSRVEDLDACDGCGSLISKQARKAYDLGLEMFVGVQFENHVSLALARDSFLKHAREVRDLVSRLYVNKDIWEAFTGKRRTFQEATSEQETEEVQKTHAAFHAWWKAKAGLLFCDLSRKVTLPEKEDETELWAGLYDGLPPRLRRDFQKAFTYPVHKFSTLEPLAEHWKLRVLQEKVRFELEQEQYVAPDFASFFRRTIPNLDTDFATRLSLRKVVSRCFEATGELLGGSRSCQDLCLFSTLDCCSRSLQANFDGIYDYDAQWQALLHLAQSDKSPIACTVEELCLEETAAEQIRSDAAEVLRQLGAPLDMHTRSHDEFSCKSDYGDLDLAAHGCVVGVCDFLFPEGPLEVKATLLNISAEHCAQAIWYACSFGSQKAYLWDVYRRRLLVWDRLPSRSAYFTACISEYLRRNPPPGASHSKVIKERQVIRLGPRDGSADA